jgi:transcriptional regulator with XRE-family HTH domain
MAQENWQARLTRVVAEQVRHHRQVLGMSAQELSDRCAELGLPIPRPVLSNLENGRRDSVSVAELIILARALEVAPVALAMPLGRQETTELFPGQQVPTWDAARWFAGELLLAPQDGHLYGRVPGFAGRVDPADPVAALRRHDELVEAWRAHRDLLLAKVAGSDADRRIRDAATEGMQQAETELRRLRAGFRRAELIPPQLPPELADIEESGQDARTKDVRTVEGYRRDLPE